MLLPARQRPRFPRPGTHAMRSCALIAAAAALCAQPAVAHAPAAAVPSLTLQETLIGECAPGSKIEGALTAVDHFAWAEKKDGRQTVRLDGQRVGGVYDDIGSMRFSADRQHLAFTAKRDSKWVLVVDGQERTKPYGPEMDDFITWRISKDRAHVAVAASIDKHWTWIVDGRPCPGFDVVSDIAFTSDWQHHAYAGANSRTGAAKSRIAGTLVEDGKATADYAGSGFGTGVLGAMFGSFSYMMTGVRAFAADFHGLSNPQYTPDGKLVYAARRAEGEVVVFTGGMPGPAFENVVSPIVFSRDGRHLVYVASRGGAFVEVRDHEAGIASPAPGAEPGVGFLALSPDGQHLAYEVVRGGSSYRGGNTSRAHRHVVIDGRDGPDYDALDTRGFSFAGTGPRHFYIVVGADGTRDRLVFSGAATRLFDNVFSGSVEWIDDGTIEFVAQDGLRILKVTVSIEQPGRASALRAPAQRQRPSL